MVYEHVTIIPGNFTLASISISNSLGTIMRRFCRIIFCGAVFGNCSDSGGGWFCFGADRGWQFALVGYSYYLLYEGFAFSYHTRAGGLLKRIPFVGLFIVASVSSHRADVAYNFNKPSQYLIKFSVQYKE